MANSYFTLSDSTESKTKKFGVISGGYFPTKSKSQNIQSTIDGKLDIAIGAIYERHTYTIRVRENETRDGHGNINDLSYFYGLNNPNGSPSNILTFIDHFGVTHHAVMTGEFTPTPLSVTLEGDDAWYTVLCVFPFIPE